MAQQNRTTLKGYFNTGDTPTEAQFADLIDSFHNPSNDGAVQVQPSEGAFANGDKTKLDGIATGATANSDESIQDLVGAMLTGNTETRITVTYQDADGTIDFVVDNDLSNYDNSSSGFAVAATLASTANGNGAALIGVEDSADWYTGTTIEAILGEIGSSLDDLLPWASELPSAYLQTDDITNRVYAQDAGGSATATRVSGPDSVYWYNWFVNGNDAPSNATSADQYSLPDGLGSLVGKTANYTFADSDRGKIIAAESGSLTFTIDDETSTPIKYGSALQPWFGVANYSGNPLTLQADTGVSLNGASAGSITIPDGGSGMFSRVGSDSWRYIGDAS